MRAVAGPAPVHPLRPRQMSETKGVMSTRQIAMLIVGLAFVLSSEWGIYLYFQAERLNNWLTLEQIAGRVSTDLPRGTSLSDIDKYFTENQVEHSYYQPTNEVFAMIRYIWGGKVIIQKDASITIELDQDRKLKQVKVDPVFTGP
jgi:hypothetical protein